MKKIITTTLFVLSSGLILSTNAVADPFNRGSAYTNAISNAHANTSIQQVQSAPRSAATNTVSGFNMRSVVENENTTVNRGTSTPVPTGGMYTVIGQFNDRG